MGAMKALARLEKILQELVERPQWLLTPKRIHPLQMAAAITRAFETQTLHVGDRVIAPNDFTLRLNPDDFDQFTAERRTLEREFAMYVTRAVAERGLVLSAPATVSFTSDDSVRPGGIEVDATFREAEPPPPTLQQRLRSPVAGFTEKIERDAVAPFAAPAVGQAALELLSDSGRVLRSFPIQGQIVTIGRRSGNDIALLDLEVSRQHARIDYVPPRYYVSDLGSTNGTRVNSRPVQGRQALTDGDVIELGRQRLRFRFGA